MNSVTSLMLLYCVCVSAARWQAAAAGSTGHRHSDWWAKSLPTAARQSPNVSLLVTDVSRGDATSGLRATISRAKQRSLHSHCGQCTMVLWSVYVCTVVSVQWYCGQFMFALWSVYIHTVVSVQWYCGQFMFALWSVYIHTVVSVQWSVYVCTVVSVQWYCGQFMFALWSVSVLAMNWVINCHSVLFCTSLLFVSYC